MGTVETKLREYYQQMDKRCPTIAKYSRNLNLCALNEKLDPCYHRSELLLTVQKLLLRKNKANILLTGEAGCGKTAVAEGLASAITQRNLEYTKEQLQAERRLRMAKRKWEANGKTDEEPVQEDVEIPLLSRNVIYDLSLNGLVGGTRYRGEFEERLENVIREARANPNVILFVDELHHLCTVGAAEGCVSAAQILKPALARNEVRMIGATTTLEKEVLLQDKALARRFCQVEVPLLTGAVAVDTARSLLDYYCKYHRITTRVTAEQLMNQVNFHLPNTVFPDNFINLVDETLAGAVFEGVSTVNMAHFNETLSRMTGRVILSAETIETRQAG